MPINLFFPLDIYPETFKHPEICQTIDLFTCRADILVWTHPDIVSLFVRRKLNFVYADAP